MQSADYQAGKHFFFKKLTRTEKAASAAWPDHAGKIPARRTLTD